MLDSKTVTLLISMLTKCHHVRLRISHGLFSKIFDSPIRKPMRRKIIFQGRRFSGWPLGTKNFT